MPNIATICLAGEGARTRRAARYLSPSGGRWCCSTADPRGRRQKLGETLCRLESKPLLAENSVGGTDRAASLGRKVSSASKAPKGPMRPVRGIAFEKPLPPPEMMDAFVFDDLRWRCLVPAGRPAR